MGQVSSAFDPDGRADSNAPAGYIVPPFPSLYNPTIVSTKQQRGYFLHDAEAIWRYTFYWTLILLGGTFEACAALAVWSLLMARSRQTWQTSNNIKSKFAQRKRPPLWLVLLIPIAMALVACFVALVSGTVVGFALAAVYSAGGFSMSTWVPFMWGMIQVVVLITASYSSLTRIL